MAKIKMTNVVDGSVTELKINESLKIGERFRLIGNTTNVKSILGGTVPVVHGTSECGKFRTSARVEDTAAV